MKLIRSVLTLILPALLFGAGGCFTGVESTPRIKESDVRQQQAAGISSEQMFLSDITPVPPRLWTPDRQWLVANNRISLIFSPKSDNTDNLAGHTIRFEGVAPAKSLTGDDAGEITFRSDDGRRLYYHVPGLSASKIDTLSRLDVPFTVDLDIVAKIDSGMVLGIVPKPDSGTASHRSADRQRRIWQREFRRRRLFLHIRPADT